jgi:hypothetical protein
MSYEEMSEIIDDMNGMGITEAEYNAERFAGEGDDHYSDCED